MTDRKESLQINYQRVCERIDRAINTSNSEALTDTTAKHVSLLAVSKTYPSTDIEILYHMGQRLFGENYLQEASSKITLLKKYIDIEWHFIGYLQSNKSKTVAEQFNWLHTLSSEKLARRLNHQRPAALPPLNVLIQINIDQEPSKSGILPEELLHLADTIQALDQLKLRGIMAIPAPLSTPGTASSASAFTDKRDNQGTRETAYSKMADLFHQLKDHCINSQIDTLSMGMSRDLEMAIAHGATIVRIGTDIFGPRKN